MSVTARHYGRKRGLEDVVHLQLCQCLEICQKTHIPMFFNRLISVEVCSLEWSVALSMVACEV